MLLFESIVIELLGWPLRITTELLHALAVAAIVVALLATLCWLLQVSEPAQWRAIVTLIGTVLVLQVGLLRLLTPALADHEVMSVLDGTAMSLPAVLSLVWAMLGAALALWSGRTGLRST